MLKKYLAVCFLISAATEWIPALPSPTERTSVLLKDLVTGDKLYFRITAINLAGTSQPAMIKESVTVQEILRKCLGSIPEAIYNYFFNEKLLGVQGSINLFIGVHSS